MPSAPPEKMGPPSGKPSALPKGSLLPRDQVALVARSELAEQGAEQHRAEERGGFDSADEASMPPSHSRASVAPLGAATADDGRGALLMDDSAPDDALFDDSPAHSE